MSEIKDITERIKTFRDARDWKQFHNHKDMALSLVLEAAELLEHFQWKNPTEIEGHVKQNHDALSDELADVAMYLFELADNLGINITDAIEGKMKRTTKNTPSINPRESTRSTRIYNI